MTLTDQIAETTTAADATNSLGAVLSWGPDRPVHFGGLSDVESVVRPVPLAEIFTANEQRARTSQSYVRSSVGERLRFESIEDLEVERAAAVRLTQHDPQSGLRVATLLVRPVGTRSLRITHEVTNAGDEDVIITAVVSAVIGVGFAETDLDDMTLTRGESEWLAESRWQEAPLRTVVPRLTLDLHAQDGRGRFAVTSHGAWPTGENHPVGIISDSRTGTSIGWQIEAGTAWQWSIGQTLEGAFLSLTGPADLEHHFARRLAPGDTFTSVPAAIVLVTGGRDDAAAELTRYRRWLRTPRFADEARPVIYNDFMNTLMGDPSTEKLRPLIASAAQAGAEYFCVDAGWFAHAGDWWDTVGEWREDPDRFTDGFAAVLDEIRAAGMIAGTWVEPEVVGVNSPAARALPDEAFFHRFGVRVVEHGRYHLDFRHPAAIAHLDEVIDRLVLEYGVGFLKLDYNINPGAGTEWRAEAAGDGLLEHSRAYLAWLRRIQERHSELLIENCASGAMRMDYAYLADAHVQSTSDQQDFRLYPVIAASSLMSVVPEQAGNWAYPASSMTDEETAFTMVTGLAGRMVLSGFLDQLRTSQVDLVSEAVSVSKQWRDRLAQSVPFWPLGLPGWEDTHVAVGFDCGAESLLVVWNRTEEESMLELPLDAATLDVVYPVGGVAAWPVTSTPGGLVLHVPSGASARVFRTQNR